jgi:hypothetical protein
VRRNFRCRDFSASEIFREVGEVGSDRGLIDHVRVEIRINPLGHAVVVEVLGIDDRLQ